MEKLAEIITLIFKNRGAQVPCKIEMHTRLREDLGFDSFDLAELTVRVEQEFGVDVFEDSNVESVADICKKIKI